MPALSTEPVAGGTQPAATTPLYTWMRRHGVTLDQLAPLLHCTIQHLSRIRTAKVRPSDAFKLDLATVTRSMDVAAGRRPVGVRVRDWYRRDQW